MQIKVSNSVDNKGIRNANYKIRQKTVCDRADSWNNFVGGIIGSLLTDGPSSPLYQKLIESGLGSDYATGTGFLAYLKDSLFCAGLRDARVEDLDKIIELVVEGKSDHNLH